MNFFSRFSNKHFEKPPLLQANLNYKHHFQRFLNKVISIELGIIGIVVYWVAHSTNSHLTKTTYVGNYCIFLNICSVAAPLFDIGKVIDFFWDTDRGNTVFFCVRGARLFHHALIYNKCGNCWFKPNSRNSRRSNPN